MHPFPSTNQRLPKTSHGSCAFSSPTTTVRSHRASRIGFPNGHTKPPRSTRLLPPTPPLPPLSVLYKSAPRPTFLPLFASHHLVAFELLAPKSAEETSAEGGSRREEERDGPYEADRPQVHRREGPPQAARHQGSFPSPLFLSHFLPFRSALFRRDSVVVSRQQVVLRCVCVWFCRLRGSRRRRPAA